MIDLDGLDIDDIRVQFPEVYQHLYMSVKPGRDHNNEEYRRINWWLFGRNNTLMRGFTAGLSRYIATPVTQKHRTFEFISHEILPDDALMVIGQDDAFVLGTLQSRIFASWFGENASTLEDRPRFIKAQCWDPFPFPAANDLQKHRIRAQAENLDAHRKRVLADHSHLTLTGLYNVLEKLRAGEEPDALTTNDRRIFDDGLVLIMKEYHDKLDTEVAAAYGWPADLSDTEILARLVALNAQRAREEAGGLVRWLRPDYQIPRFGTARDKLALTGGAMRGAQYEVPTGPKPSFPSDNVAQTATVMAALASSAGPVGAEALATGFRQGRRALPQIASVLAALARMGFVASPDGGKSFALRRAA